MTSSTILFRSLRYYWRTHLGVLLGAALGSMVLTGALLVGDSVKATLRLQALDRVGRAVSALVTSEQFFRTKVDARNSSGETDIPTAAHAAPVLFLRGSVSRADGSARINQAQVLGVDGRFWTLAPHKTEPIAARDHISLNRRAAAQLGVKSGDTIVLRVEKPSAFSRDAPLSGEENEVVAIRAAVGDILDDDHYGRFGLQASQVAPFSVYLPLDILQKRLDLTNRANLLISDESDGGVLKVAVTKAWQLPDAGFELRRLKTGGVELRTSRVFLDKSSATAALSASEEKPVAALTYFVNELSSGDHAAPYSMATAVDTATAGFLPSDLADGEIVINQWLAEDLGIDAGAKLTLKYFVMAERRQLIEKSREFTVRAVLPMTDPQVNPSWMPDFPGLADKNNCRDWKPGFSFDSTRIRDKDQQYWDQYRGTPKAFVNLHVGQEMWANRWGDLTSVRWPAAKGAGEIGKALRGKLTLDQLGFQFIPLRQQALAATDAPVDFGELFVSFSFFLLAAAAVLTGLLFVFSLEQRNREAGLLLALGLRPPQVRRLFLWEGTVLAVIGSVLGIGGAVLYTKVVLQALTTVWSGAVGGVAFVFSPDPVTMGIGVVSSIFIALLSMWLASRRQLRHSARDLLASAASLEMAPANRPKGRAWSFGIGLISLLGAGACLGLDKSGSSETFFCAGGLLLIAGLAFGLAWLRHMAAKGKGLRSLPQLGRRNAARRRGRSLATAAVLASGVFIVVAVDAFRQSPSAGTENRTSGTGGFAFVAESALPIYEDLNAPAGRESVALDEQAVKGVSFVPMRVRDGDDASCLNLNRALQPRLLGLPAKEMADRGAFRFSAALAANGAKTTDLGAAAVWPLLDAAAKDGAIPAITDDATLEWALQKKLGDTLEYKNDAGATFKVRIVATLAESMLQGSVFIAEKPFIAQYPNQGGYRFFLIDAPASQAANVAGELSRALADRGLEVTPASRRLAEFQAVENTYLSIFQALGGLGLLLGSVGLAVVVARNVLERRSEFGLLEAIGFRKRGLRKLVFAEHRWLIIFGLFVGVASALVAVWPHLQQRASGFPMEEMGILLGALALGALFWTWLATRLALRGDHIEALRSE